MKIFRLNFSIIFAVAIVFFSCEKEPLDKDIEPIIAPVEQNNPFEVVFDGSKYVSDNVESFVTSDNRISLNAQNSDSGTFLISINGVEPREYTNDELTIMYVSKNGQTYSNSVGENNNATLTITEINYKNRKIFGTFSFVGTRLTAEGTTQETKTFSEGKFHKISITGVLVEP